MVEPSGSVLFLGCLVEMEESGVIPQKRIFGPDPELAGSKKLVKPNGSHFPSVTSHRHFLALSFSIEVAKVGAGHRLPSDSGACQRPDVVAAAPMSLHRHAVVEVPV
jgi:hypothetical protein